MPENDAEKGITVATEIFGSKVPETEAPPVPQISVGEATLKAELEAQKEANKLLQSQLSTLSTRLDKVQDTYIEAISAAPVDAPPAEETLDTSELSEEGQLLVKVMNAKIAALEGGISNKATEVQSGAVEMAVAQLQAEQIKTANPETWPLVAPVAAEYARLHPGSTVQEAWNAAMVQFKPLFDARDAVKSQTQKTAEAASRNEKPKGPMGGEKKLTKREVFDANYDNAFANRK